MDTSGLKSPMPEVLTTKVPSEEAAPPPTATIENEKQTAKPRKWWYWPKRVLDFAIEQWFILGIGVFIVLAWRFPNVGKEGGSIRAEYTIHYGAIAIIFIITGLTLSTKALINQAKFLYLHFFTQVFSFLFFPTIVYAIINCIKASGNTTIDPYALVGMMVMAVMPTTVASNITMTRSALGNAESATIEVCIGNTIGVFLTPLLLNMFLSGYWGFGAPIASGGETGSQGLVQIYKQIGKQLGLALFLPLVVGQVVQNIWPVQTKKVATTLRLPKVSSFFLLTLIWSAFCNQFANNAFQEVSHLTIIFILFTNLFLYLSFTVICVVLTRLPGIERLIEGRTGRKGPVEGIPVWKRFVRAARFGKKEATAVCFCAAAKGLVVGTPVLAILYGGFTPHYRAIVSIPLVLYQGEQVFVAQILVTLFKRWNLKGEDEDLLPPPSSASAMEKGKTPPPPADNNTGFQEIELGPVLGRSISRQTGEEQESYQEKEMAMEEEVIYPEKS